MHTYRIAQIIEWGNCGQACFALLDGDEIVGRFTDIASAQAAYRMAMKAAHMAAVPRAVA